MMGGNRSSHNRIQMQIPRPLPCALPERQACQRSICRISILLGPLKFGLLGGGQVSYVLKAAPFLRHSQSLNPAARTLSCI